MKNLETLSDNKKLEAVINCDRNYDGIFLYGVKTTRIFCRPSCKSKTPLPNNVIFFHDAVSAIEAGFRPCKRCRPDKITFRPDLELAIKAKNIFDANYNKDIKLNQISNQLGVSTNHLIRVFKQHIGLTPIQYITKQRVRKAKELLNEKDLTILEITFAVGFKSVSNFYKCFKEQTGHTPNELRKKLMSKTKLKKR